MFLALPYVPNYPVVPFDMRISPWSLGHALSLLDTAVCLIVLKPYLRSELYMSPPLQKAMLPTLWVFCPQ